MVVRYFCALIYLYLIDYYLSSLDDLALFPLFSIVNAGRKVSVDYDIGIGIFASLSYIIYRFKCCSVKILHTIFSEFKWSIAFLLPIYLLLQLLHGRQNLVAVCRRFV